MPFNSKNTPLNMDIAKKNIFITGLPGIGKTTVIREIIRKLPPDITLSGFLTEEIREGANRVGFSVKTLDGSKGILAHINISSVRRVGRYGVDVNGFERTVLPRLTPHKALLYIIDEVGKMECFSLQFCKAVLNLLNSKSPVLGTVAVKGGGLISELKTRPDVKLFTVTRTNRDTLPDEIMETLLAFIH
ncbi:MAG: NTPase [Syntrophales bacterium]|nr:NTPase [Syntrophales bacterium]